MAREERIELVSDLIQGLREAEEKIRDYTGPIPEKITLPNGTVLTEQSSWSEFGQAQNLWTNGGWQPDPSQLKAIVLWSTRHIPEGSTIGQYIHGEISSEDLITQFSSPEKASLTKKRQTIFEVILRQAASQEEWKESLAGLMLANEISEEEIELELEKRKG